MRVLGDMLGAILLLSLCLGVGLVIGTMVGRKPSRELLARLEVLEQHRREEDRELAKTIPIRRIPRTVFAGGRLEHPSVRAGIIAAGTVEEFYPAGWTQ